MPKNVTPEKHRLGLRIEAVQKAQLAISMGFAFPCSMCRRLWKAMDRGETDCDQGNRCGGPLGGKSFRRYQGPLDREAIASHCIRCGKPQSKDGAGFLRHPTEDGGTVGLCAHHSPMLDDRLVPVEKMLVKP